MMRVRRMSLWLVAGLCLMVGGVFIFGVLPFAWLLSKASTMEDYLATVSSAATKLPIAVEFETIFPSQTDHFITHYGFNRWGGDRTNTWNSEAYFYGRYSLTMQVEVIVDYKSNTIVQAGKPMFYLEEITSFDGQTAWYDGVHTKFGEEEWQKIYQSGGDFSVIGLAIRKDAPVPDFEQLVVAVRRPRIPITLLDTNEQHADVVDVNND